MRINSKARLLASVGFAILFAAGAASAAELSVGIDQSRMVRLTAPISTISVGNPAIADVSLENGIMFVLGKTFGQTNVLALDSKGDTVLDLEVSVTKSDSGSLTVYRGTRQVSYNCAPTCERSLVPGDDSDNYNTLSGQITNKMSVVSGAGE